MRFYFLKTKPIGLLNSHANHSFKTINLILLHYFSILASYMSPAELAPNSYPQDQYDANYESGNYGDDGYEG